MTSGGDGDPGAFPDAVIVLAGGAGSRLGGVDKAELRVGGRTLLDRALAAAAGRPVILVGPSRAVPAGVTVTREDPPGGGPAAGVAAGLAALLGLTPTPDASAGPVRPGPTPDASTGPVRPGPASGTGPTGIDPLVAVLAVDQPGVNAGTLARLAAAVPQDRRTGAVLVHQGRRQHAVGVYPIGALAQAVQRRADWHGVALRRLLAPVIGAEVPAGPGESDDVDTPEDLARWQRARPEILPPDSRDGTGSEHRRR